MTGQALGRYRIEAKLGAGGMGEVFRAHDERLDRDVAIKVLPAFATGEEAARARLLREARAAAALNHPHICIIHEVGEADGQVYIAMELLEGQTLSGAIARGGMPVARVLRLGAQIADALAHAHERGIVHRDLKSGNVVVTPDGRAKVLDFGLAKRVRGEELKEATTQSLPSLTHRGAVLGTLPYMAPEQLRGQMVDARSDVWALGVVLYEMAAGDRPFTGRTGHELSAAILGQPPGPLPARVPVELRAVVERCLEKEPGQRYQRAGEVRAALEAIASGAAPKPHRVPRGSLLRAVRWPVPLAIGVALVAIAALSFNLWGLRERLFGSARPKIESIAVLPFSSISPDRRDELLELGLAETLIARLSRSSSLRVRSLASAQRFADPERDAIDAGRQLGAAYVVTGSTQLHGDRVRVNARLLTVPEGSTVWADTFDEAIDRVFTLQDGIAGAVTAALALKTETTPVQHRSPCEGADADAYRALLTGRYLMGRLSAVRLPNAIAAFHHAIDLDPSCARAYAGLAWVYRAQAINSDRDPREIFPLASAAAANAIAIDRDSAEGYAARGFIEFWHDWDWSAAETSLERAIALAPSSVDAHYAYAHLLISLGRFDAGLDHMRQARELDPLSPLLNTLEAAFLGAANRPDVAGQGLLARALELEPDFWVALRVRGGMALDHGDRRAAIADLNRAVERSGENSQVLALLAMTYVAVSDRARAQSILDELESRDRDGYVPATALATVHNALGDTEIALDLLERAYRERDVRLTFLKIDARWNSLRTHPRFKELSRRLGLESEWAYGRF